MISISTSKEELLHYLRTHYSDEKNETLAAQLGISLSSLRRLATQNHLHKSSAYLQKQHTLLMEAKLQKYNQSIKFYSLTQREQNILIGSLLGDGSVALYGRSKHAHYREHGAVAQLPYRLWKVEQLARLDFKTDRSGKISSPSNPLYTQLLQQFYENGRKKLDRESLKLLDHPIGLACLYMDDGSLVIDINHKADRIYLLPRVYIYSLNFTREENQMLRDHLEAHFGIPFKLKKHPDGEGWMLELNRRNEVYLFIKLVAPYIAEIPCMSYKIELENRMRAVKSRLMQEGKQNIILSPLQIQETAYTKEDANRIIQWKKEGLSDRSIAEQLGRTYWGVVDKVRRLRKEGRLT